MQSKQSEPQTESTTSDKTTGTPANAGSSSNTGNPSNTGTPSNTAPADHLPLHVRILPAHVQILPAKVAETSKSAATAGAALNQYEILCLHGWGQNHKSFLALGKLLTPYGNVHLIDLPGFGDSPAPPASGWSTTDYADRIAAYIKEQGLSQVILIGHSFGGRISLRLARKYPELLTRFALINSAGLQRHRTPLEQLRASCIRQGGKLLKRCDSLLGSSYFKDWFSPRFGSRDYLNAGDLKATFIKTITEDQEQEVPHIHHPALLLWGELDTETPLEMGKRFNRLLPNSQLIVLDGRDHNCFQEIDAHLCAFYLRDFISQN